MNDAANEPVYRKKIHFQAALLAGFSTLAAALLIGGNLATHEAIAARQEEDLLRSLSLALPDSLHDNNLLDHVLEIKGPNGAPLTIYRALKEGKITGYAWQVTGQGYAGDIGLIMSVDRDGNILIVRVLSHAETPGLGDKIEVEKNDWINRFTGHSLVNTTEAQWHVKKDGGEFDQFSGATITPRGVVKAVHAGLAFFKDHRAELSTFDAHKPNGGKQS
ncbi:MAG: electron transport complex subunit RsxG [Gammaproteobacteria bacterium]|nr:electron transport complex subunit RsxG [Gammaproteobacteria bacterium]